MTHKNTNESVEHETECGRKKRKISEPLIIVIHVRQT